MRIKPIQLQNSNQLINDYRAQKEQIKDFFHYHPFEDFDKRVTDLKNRTFNRGKLTSILLEMNNGWDAPSSTLQQIDRLKDENSVVIIGGQQAGLLTGPMYTLNKIISIIKLAKEQENKLQIPVIPVFWIAGEDHDFDEINHIFSLKDQKIYKHTTKQAVMSKKSVSHLEIDKEKTFVWVERAFRDLKETTFSKTIFDQIVSCLEQSNSYVDFFARLIYQLFPDEGVVLIDSAHPLIRNFESSYFKQFIQKQKLLAKSIYDTVQTLQQKGYSIPLEVEEDDANLFYHDENNERILLKRLEEIWVGKNDEVDLTTEQMMEIAEYYPTRLSNNVVTRPIMQELLFPSLAFVGGDGEIAYWAALRNAFQLFDLNMPPVVPRLSFTFITSRIEKLLETRVIELEDVINDGIEDVKVNWLMSQQTPPVQQLFSEVKQSITEVHRPLRHLAQTISADFSDEAQKNLEYLHEHITYLEQKTWRKLSDKYERQLGQFDEINHALRPNQVLQERMWSPLPFVNENGFDFIKNVIQIPNLSLQNNHYVIFFT